MFCSRNQEIYRAYGRPFLRLFYLCLIAEILVYSWFLRFSIFFLYKGIIFPILRIEGYLPSENARFIRSDRGSLIGFLNCLNICFGMLERPVFLLFLRFFL